MSSTPEPQNESQSGGPPYPPRNAMLGGLPTVLPDVPVTSVFLVLYFVFGIVHFVIFRKNKDRGHKFIFNAAIFGLCKIRIITMSLRLAWTYYPRNVNLGLAANVVCYCGMIIPLFVNWFFVQRIIRAQHARIGWSVPYRIFHRAALIALIIALCLLIAGSICQSYTLDPYLLNVYRWFHISVITYFTAFCLTPAVLVLISAIVPRTEVEKFGAGRLRINIAILLASVTLLAIGQIFRCVIAWIPPVPLRNAEGEALESPWYLGKACFYVFNFLVEILVVLLFAVVRVDLRFHVPNGSKIAGDYSGRNSRYTLGPPESEKHFAADSLLTSHENNSSETLHQYSASLFNDTRTLADSLKYGSSTLEVDQTTGHWKVKRVSHSSAGSRASLQSSSIRTSLGDRSTLAYNNNSTTPPVPFAPKEWPLPHTPRPRTSIPVLEHSNPPSRRGTPLSFPAQNLYPSASGTSVSAALSQLEQNSASNKGPPPCYACCPPPPIEVYQPTLPVGTQDKGKGVLAKCPTCHQKRTRKRSTYPPNTAVLHSAQSRSSTMLREKNSGLSERVSSPQTIREVPSVPLIPRAYTPGLYGTALPSPPPASSPSTNHRRSPSSLEIISLSPSLSPAQHVASSTGAHRVVDVSLQGEAASLVAVVEHDDIEYAGSEEARRSGESMGMRAGGGYGLARQRTQGTQTEERNSRRFSFGDEPVEMLRAVKTRAG
ncbi:hypothetical protein IQ07DRAFT_588093 [Pyrenochaeta sp. DS3sAY3a]|nr:hypothetical protein IQ07DRAFT_588093 [Pyrenochaeta sp. DS3sAY3a]